VSDKYRIVTVTLRQRRRQSIMVDSKHRPGWDCISRSLIHGGDDIKIDRGELAVDTNITIRIAEWKAEELGLA
jgi:hypothetical protein